MGVRDGFLHLFMTLTAGKPKKCLETLYTHSEKRSESVEIVIY